MALPDTLSAIRFGTGLPATGAVPGGAAALLDDLTGPDTAQAAFPQDPYRQRVAAARAYLQARQARRAGGEAEDAAFRQHRRQIAEDIGRQLALTLARGVAAPLGFRERLAWFWADHFTTVGTRGPMRGAIQAYVEEAIRPHIAGRFPDLLRSAALHPVMILYLDQDSSTGPNSRVGLRRGRGLNENLAREILELHTMGGGFTQRDVTEFAELLTGVSADREGVFQFNQLRAEPGPEEVLGQSYGAWRPAQLAHVEAALSDLALRPETARHLSTKLARHFLADAPPVEVIAAMTEAYQTSGGDLMATYEALLTHPAAWAPTLAKAKSPLLFLTSAMKALAVPAAEIAHARPRDIRAYADRPMQVMGQRWQGAPGPDGFPDSLDGWIRPQTLAARIGWAMLAPDRLGDAVPDPRRFVHSALGDLASPALIWAAARAETRAEGVGLILASPEFQRR